MTFKNLVLSLIAVAFALSSPSSFARKGDPQHGLRAAHDQFYTALNTMFTGDIAPMQAIWSHQGDVTQLDPFGGRFVGWTAVGEEWAKTAAMKLGGKVVAKDVLIYVGKDLGYTVCVEEGENMSADGKPVAVKFRATNIFRLEKGAWKMVHHHTDPSPALQRATATEN